MDTVAGKNDAGALITVVNDILKIFRGRPLDRNADLLMLRRLGKRVGVHAYPHKFRHTGVTMFLRNGGNVFALQEILRHSSLEMVQRYVHLAQVDTEEPRRQANPVYYWGLRV